MTRMVAPLTDESIFGRPGSRTAIKEVIDGTSNTVMVIQAPSEAAVIWTKPEDLQIDVKFLKESIFGKQAKGILACMCDGAVNFRPNTLDAETLNAVLTIDGKDDVTAWWR